LKVELWGTRGSLASPGADTVRYGGNTSCVEVRGDDGSLLVLDAGTGIRCLGASVEPGLRRIDLLITHLHMDHIQGLGFFSPLFRPDLEVHIWGPPSTTLDLRARLSRYLSPPLFPVRLRDLPSRVTVHDTPSGRFAIGRFELEAALVCHPGPTVGYRISDAAGSLAYLPDHEPALGVRDFPQEPEWTSGFDLARGVDVLIHDTQYTAGEYHEHVGWGHSSLDQAVAFAGAAGVGRLVTFHHDPDHSDAKLDAMLATVQPASLPVAVVPGCEGTSFRV